MTPKAHLPQLRVIENGKNENEKSIILDGCWDFRTPKSKLESLKKALQSDIESIEFDKDCAIDFVFGTFLLQQIYASAYLKTPNLSTNEHKISHKSAHQNQNISLPRIIAQNHIKQILQNCENRHIKKPRTFASLFRVYLRGARRFGRRSLKNLGKFVYQFSQSFIDFINFVGMTFYFLGICIWKREIRFAPLFYHINESGFKALPVSLLTAFIAGFAIGLQGAVQLENLGAPLMSVETVAKLSLREMGPFILALVIAGRSASSFTAEIGVMRLTEEIDAMKTMGFNPVVFLVIPRFLALVIIMPFLVFLADAMSLLGGMLAVFAQVGIGFNAWIERFYETVDFSHFLIGVIKAPFFGAAIALVGCFRGFCIRENTQELGQATTISVVNALFWCITIDAIFSFITARLNI